MDIQKELESFKTVAIAKGWSIDGETTQTNYRFYSLTTNSGWEMWQAAKAQAVPEWIYVEDRMPEEGEEVWVHHYGHIVQATKDKKYSGGFKQRNCRGWESVSCYISHWMSMSIKLPEIYNFYYEHDAKVAQEKAIIEAQEQKG